MQQYQAKAETIVAINTLNIFLTSFVVVGLIKASDTVSIL